NLMGGPARRATPASTRLADAPTSEPFPPRQAPSESAHHKGCAACSPPKEGVIDLIIGIMVATNGILSTKAERIAELQRMASVVRWKLPPVAESRYSAIVLITPAASKPWTRTKRPMKNISVDHST